MTYLLAHKPTDLGLDIDEECRQSASIRDVLKGPVYDNNGKMTRMGTFGWTTPHMALLAQELGIWVAYTDERALNTATNVEVCDMARARVVFWHPPLPTTGTPLLYKRVLYDSVSLWQVFSPEGTFSVDNSVIWGVDEIEQRSEAIREQGGHVALVARSRNCVDVGHFVAYVHKQIDMFKSYQTPA